MMTPPPVNAGSPHLLGEPTRSFQTNQVLTGQLLVAIGAMLDVASLGSGYMPHHLAEWLGTTLIRWAEQDRAELRERLSVK
jgi:hypothetical protein